MFKSRHRKVFLYNRVIFLRSKLNNNNIQIIFKYFKLKDIS